MSDTYTYTQVRRVDPKGGSIAGQQPVTITGFGFTFATGGVTFGGVAATSVVIVSNTSITATVPAHAVGAVDVVVEGVGTGTNLYTYQNPSTQLLPRVPVTGGPGGTAQQLDLINAVPWLFQVKKRIEQAPIVDSGSVVGGSPLTAVSDANVTATLTGTPLEALLRPVTLTLGWTGALGPTRGGTGLQAFAAGDLLYASSALVLARLTIGAANTFIKSVGGVPAWTAGAALTKTDDTNVTLTLGGSATTALVNAASLTLGWTGQLAPSRGGTGIGSYTTGDLLYASGTTTLAKRAIGSTGDVLTVSAGLPVWAPTSGLGTGDLTRTNDTNVTLTLGGTPVDALFHDVSLTLGWTGTLGVTRGGTGTGTAFTAGSVVFAGASGVYTQDNANFFWDDTNNRLGLGANASLAAVLHIKGAGTTSATVSLLTEDSGGTDTFAIRDDSSIGFGKNYTLPAAAGFYYMKTGADFGGALTITNNVNGIAAQVGGLGFQLRYSGNQEFTRAEAISVIAESGNTHSGNIITAIVGSARIATAGGLATTLLGGSFEAKSDGSTGATITTLAGLKAIFKTEHASVVATNAYGLKVDDITNTGTMTNTYGVHIGDVTAGTQTNTAYSLYSSDANALNYLAGKTGIGVTAPAAMLHLKAGTATANTAPLKFNSGTSLTTAEAGAIEFTTDDYYATITTGAARKGILLNDGTNLTSGKIPITTTNGRLIDGQTPLSGAKVYYVSDTSGGAVTRKLTFTDGILTAET